MSETESGEETQHILDRPRWLAARDNRPAVSIADPRGALALFILTHKRERVADAAFLRLSVSVIAEGPKELFTMGRHLRFAAGTVSVLPRGWSGELISDRWTVAGRSGSCHKLSLGGPLRRASLCGARRDNAPLSVTGTSLCVFRSADDRRYVRAAAQTREDKTTRRITTLFASIGLSIIASGATPKLTLEKKVCPDGTLPLQIAACIATAEGRDAPGNNKGPGISLTAGPASTPSYAITLVDADLPPHLSLSDPEHATLAAAKAHVLASRPVELNYVINPKAKR